MGVIGGSPVQAGGGGGGGGATDANAIHDNVAAEISAIAEKVTPINADLIVIEDSAAANIKKRVQIGNLPGVATDAIWDAAGDLVQGTGANTAARLAIGAAFQWPRVNAGATALEYAVNPAARIRHSANQSITQNVVTPLVMDTEDVDTDTMHYTSAANLTGTVDKAAASATLTGHSCAFTTELSVGQMIKVPGTADEYRVVTAIANDDSLTVNAAFANTANGQTAARYNGGIVFRTPGLYLLSFQIAWAVTSSNTRRYVIITHNPSGATLAYHDTNSPQGAGDYYVQKGFDIYQMAQWDAVYVQVLQATSGALNVIGNLSQTPVLGAARIG